MKKKGKIIFIPVSELLPNPFQPRSTFDELSLTALTESIKQFGVLQPLCVTPRGKLPMLTVSGQTVSPPKYSIIAGERRWRAAKAAGLRELPCVVIDCVQSDMAYMAFAENVFREDLSFFDIASSLSDMLLMSGLSQAELSKKLSISQPAIANKLRLLKFTPDERSAILNAGLTERHARALIRVEDRKKREALIKKAAESSLSVAETEKLVSALLAPPAPSIRRQPVTARGRHMGRLTDVSVFFNTIDHAVRAAGDCGVSIERSQRDCGDKIELTLRIPKLAVR